MTFPDEAHLWNIVHPDSDVAPDLSASHTQSARPTGWQGVNSDPFTAEMYIDQFLPLRLFHLLAQWTNSRARIDEAENYLNGENNFRWKEVDAVTMKTFIALTLLTGIVKKSVMKSYWATEPLLDTPYFRSCMSRDRYVSILHYIRFSNPYNVEKENKETRLSCFMLLMKQLCDKYIPEDRGAGTILKLGGQQFFMKR